MDSHIIRSLWSIFLLVFLAFPVVGQVSIKDSSINLTTLQITYRGLATGGDMADRYGFNSQLGVDISYTFKNNFYIQTGGHALFSEAIREPGLLENISTAGGLLIGNTGTLSGIRLIQSGFVIPLIVGKMFPGLGSPNPNSGFFLEVGGQFIQHKINITPTDDDVAGISKAYRKGYDRLSNGIGVVESIGYRYIGNQGFLNFIIAADFSQNFTQSRRSINFDTGLPDETKRLDLLSGFRVAWIFPLYNRAPNKVYYR